MTLESAAHIATIVGVVIAALVLSQRCFDR